MSDEPKLAWAKSKKAHREAADFFAAVIATDTAYISHGEIQMGLSADGKTWAPDLKKRFQEDLEDVDDEERSVALARDGAGKIIGAAIVQWAVTDRVKFGVLEDLAVLPDLRSQGLGAKLVDMVHAEARARKMGWVFLESGIRNERAHDFFDRHGFEAISKVFAKKL